MGSFFSLCVRVCVQFWLPRFPVAGIKYVLFWPGVKPDECARSLAHTWLMNLSNTECKFKNRFHTSRCACVWAYVSHWIHFILNSTRARAMSETRLYGTYTRVWLYTFHLARWVRLICSAARRADTRCAGKLYVIMLIPSGCTGRDCNRDWHEIRTRVPVHSERRWSPVQDARSCWAYYLHAGRIERHAISQPRRPKRFACLRRGSRVDTPILYCVLE